MLKGSTWDQSILCDATSCLIVNKNGTRSPPGSCVLSLLRNQLRKGLRFHRVCR
ncbi:hypothetical protein AtNW77_Chr4g0316811 [Arabidopsis thaliana]|uniref:Uncharacterized protein n=2 Tax=Arabidopsis thaliana TaxID=3702 RepID=A0A178UXQ7_ARATH|nr:hypothetical protein AXX17_AT4G42400 [Arabidopsis thaliana]BAC41961.1 unknown protein [Arabidopsis thaliana]